MRELQQKHKTVGEKEEEEDKEHTGLKSASSTALTVPSLFPLPLKLPPVPLLSNGLCDADPDADPPPIPGGMPFLPQESITTTILTPVPVNQPQRLNRSSTCCNRPRSWSMRVRSRARASKMSSEAFRRKEKSRWFRRRRAEVFGSVAGGGGGGEEGSEGGGGEVVEGGVGGDGA